MKVLITSGGTREPIDSVRFVSNVSTGRLGAAVAGAFLDRGHSVVYLRGVGAVEPARHAQLTAVEFTSAASLLAEAERQLCGPAAPDVLIHAAAVADYAPVPVEGKIKSTEPELVLRLLPTPKVADRLRARAPDLPMILFKLESGIDRAELVRRARATLARVRAQAVVANLIEDVGEQSHRADLLRADGSAEIAEGRPAIAAALVREAERLAAERGARQEQAAHGGAGT